jgi:integrase
MGARRGTLALVAADGAVPVSPGAVLLEEMLAGWRCQQQARRLTARLIGERERVVRQFAEFTGCWPWQWTAAQAEGWVASGGWAHSTVRSYEGALALFLGYVCDPRYGWVSECEQRVGTVPVQVFHERNTAAHVCEHEGRAERRPLTRAELQAFFDAADDHAEKAAGSRRKGWLAGFRDATLFKVVYGWAAPPGGGDAGRGRLRAQPGRSRAGQPRGVSCPVRHGDAGQPPRRRAVATVMPWAAEALAQYLGEVRPWFAVPSHPALWLTERGGRISPRSVDERFAAWRAAAGLPRELSVHCLRHSYISHLIEDGADPLFVQQQAGHSWAPATAAYTTVGQDARNRMLRSALARAFEGEDGR